MNIIVCFRNNDGIDSVVEANSLEDAGELAAKARTTSNHMVYLSFKGERIRRWDRDRIAGENRWRVVDNDEFEILGKIREVCRS